MAYLVKADLLPFVEQDVLDTVSQGSDANIETACREAEAFAKAFLNHHYDIATEYAKTGSARDTLLVSKLVDIALFNLHKALPSNQVPERRLFFYQEAEKWLEMAKEGEITLDLATYTTEEGETKPSRFLYGSNTKIQSHGY